MKDKINANSILLAIVLALSGWTLKEVVALKVSLAEVRAKLGLTSSVVINSKL